MLDRRDLKVIFMGTPEFAGTNLKALIDAGFDVRLVLCQPDKPVGRKHILTAPPVKVMAQENNIEVYQPDTLRNEEALAKLSSYEPDLIVTAAYGKILPSSILDLPKYGCINCHGSLLPARRGVPQIEVTFDIDANGIVNVSAKDLGTGKEQHITITAGSNMSDDDIEKAVKEAAEYEAQDKKRKEAIDARNDADSMVFQVEKALNEVGDKIDASEKAGLEGELNALKDLLEKTKDQELSEDQVAEIKAAQEKMMASAQGLFTKMYEGMQGAAGAGPDMSQFTGADMGGEAQSSAAADDVVDGDFREV